MIKQMPVGCISVMRLAGFFLWSQNRPAQLEGVFGDIKKEEAVI